MVKVMWKMKYLEEFYFSHEDFDQVSYNYAPIELLTDLPFKFLSSGNFSFATGNIEDIVNTLSQIKTLVGFEIYQDLEENYQLSPDELKLFKDIPINNLDLEALDLTEENVVEFRKVMKEMKITSIEAIEDVDFEIKVKDFGPGGIYKTI